MSAIWSVANLNKACHSLALHRSSFLRTWGPDVALLLLFALRALAAESLEAEWRDSASEVIFPVLMLPRVRAPNMARFITVGSGVGRTRAGGPREDGGGDLGL